MNISKIKERCKAANLTLANLERTLDFGNGAISKWTTNNPNIERVKKVADYFGCTLNDLYVPNDAIEAEVEKHDA